MQSSDIGSKRNWLNQNLGSAHVVKKDVDRETGEKIKAAFLKAGAPSALLKKKPLKQITPLRKYRRMRPAKRKTAYSFEEVKKKIAKKISEASHHVRTA